jgi:predicted nucleotidyltransferase
MKVSGLGWINALPPELGRQQSLLRKMLALCETEATVSWLVIGCSLARGTADHLSDLDLAMGITDRDFAAALPRLRSAIDALGDLVESYYHQLPSQPGTHERIFAQFADRCQIDLMVFPASVPGGSVPDVVVLYDPDGTLVIRDERQPVTPDQIRSWAFRGWCALADLGKYLRRGSAWEALDCMNEARAQLWQLWAVTLHVPDPGYGLTSILDSAPDQPPVSFQGTVSDLDTARLLRAAECVAGLLNRVGEHLDERQRGALPAAMARYITNDLQQMTPSV